VGELNPYYSDNPQSNISNFSYGKVKTIQIPYVMDKNKESDNR